MTDKDYFTSRTYPISSFPSRYFPNDFEGFPGVVDDYADMAPENSAVFDGGREKSGSIEPEKRESKPGIDSDKLRSRFDFSPFFTT